MLHIISRGLWVAGTVLIVFSWMNLVSNNVGWAGFGVALVGTLLSYAGKRRPEEAPASAPSTAARLDELSRLRDRGDVTEEEFLRRKKALLGE